MKWVEASIVTLSSGVRYVEAELLRHGVTGWQVIDIEELHSFLSDNPMQWDYIDERLLMENPEFVTIKLYAADDDAGIEMIEGITEGLNHLKRSHSDVDFGPLAVTLELLDDSSWLDNWKKYYKPLEIGEKLVIKPAWEEYSHAGKIVVNIDPGHTFGTGQHETTRLCIEALEGCIKPGNTMLDLGCGSGILSIVGLLLGVEKCVALDVNPAAVKITRQNADLNGIPEEKLCIYIGDIIDSAHLQKQVKALKYDCIAANIVADAIISLSPMIVGMDCLKPDGLFIASGIIKGRLSEVVSAMTDAGFTIEETKTAGEWACIIGCLKC